MSDPQINEPTSNADAASPSVKLSVTRRRFLLGLLTSGAVGAGAFLALSQNKSGISSDSATSPASTLPVGTSSQQRITSPSTTVKEIDPREQAGLLVPGDPKNRVLVVVTLQGGNDCLSTVIPRNDGAYYDARPKLAIPEADVLPYSDDFGLSPHLERIHGRQFAVVHGVGHGNDGTQSHFDMEKRCERGDAAGATGTRTGFLARVVDQLDDANSPLVGVSVAGHSPWFNGANASVLGFQNFNELNIVTSDAARFADYRGALLQNQGGPMTTQMLTSWKKTFSLSSSLPGKEYKFDPKVHPEGTPTQLLQQLSMATEFIKADNGTRVIHARIGGFDTHTNHANRHAQLMKGVDYAIDHFLTQMEEIGREQDVCVAMTSEFGRRVAENGSGFDHGAGSTLCVVGPVHPGDHGEPASLTDLANGNLRTNVLYSSYLATLAEKWCGVEAGAVMEGEPELLDFV